MPQDREHQPQPGRYPDRLCVSRSARAVASATAWGVVDIRGVSRPEVILVVTKPGLTTRTRTPLPAVASASPGQARRVRPWRHRRSRCWPNALARRPSITRRAVPAPVCEGPKALDQERTGADEIDPQHLVRFASVGIKSGLRPEHADGEHDDIEPPGPLEGA